MPLSQYRNEIDSIDKEILLLFQKRMDTVKKVAEYKLENNLKVLHPEREAEILESKAKAASPEYKEYVTSLFEKLMELSRDMQQKMIENN